MDTPAARQEEHLAATGLATADVAATEPGITGSALAGRDTNHAVTSPKTVETAEAEPVAIDTTSTSREESPADTDSATSDATGTESCTTVGSSAKQVAPIASSYPEISGVGQFTESRVCSPKFLQPPPPLDFASFAAKLWEVFFLQQRGYRVELPCHIPRDPWDTNSTPTPTYWMSDASAPSPWAVGPASSSESEPEAPSPPGVKTRAASKLRAQARAIKAKKPKWGKRKWTGKETPWEESSSEPEDPESDRKRQKR
ncbi:hypothetical protein ISF_09028 [Cordyceps fumosorosea ARSEF 2679]|uniref:Uncharacterized protein n=1 Tax=Cordyceps fumosorosea (strain ARSEF 2679) TaxID=1081104 RepID=A0A167LGU6_CORFA|nr:hypothetical protein ISF_09028 [Cordyceps fumosorosea ARSEF 2679]OAA53074.1 hypothetical protein ISF_09028 [Cordyceps fumosorosea ARSEF 2679]